MAAGDEPLSSEEMIEEAKRDLARPSADRPSPDRATADQSRPAARPPRTRHRRRRVRSAVPRQPAETQRVLVAVIAALLVLGLGVFLAIATLAGGG